MSDAKKKVPETGTWGQLFRFIKKARLCWPLIILALIANLGYSKIMAMIPSVTGELYAGNFETSVLFRLIGTSLLIVALNAVYVIIETFAGIKSHRNLRNVLWKKMMRMDASSDVAQSADTLLSAIPSMLRPRLTM